MACCFLLGRPHAEAVQDLVARCRCHHVPGVFAIGGSAIAEMAAHLRIGIDRGPGIQVRGPPIAQNQTLCCQMDYGRLRVASIARRRGRPVGDRPFWPALYS